MKILVEAGNFGQYVQIIVENVSFKNPVPVLIEFNKGISPIGFVNLTKENGKIYAYIDFKLKKELLDLFPAVGGRLLTTSFIKNKCIIDCISLNSKPNEDPEIKTIREQIKEIENIKS
jgi:hypothetical protein